MKSRTWLLIRVVFILLTMQNSFCDSLIMTGGQSYPQVQVDSFSFVAPSGTFQIKAVTNGVLGETAFPVQENQVQTITFGPLNVDSSQHNGRIGNMTLSDGRSFPGVTIINFQFANQQGSFAIRQAGAAPTDQAFAVPSATVSQIQFASTPSAPVSTTPPPSPTEDISSLMPGAITPKPTETRVAPKAGEIKDKRFDKFMSKLENTMEKVEKEAEKEREKAIEERQQRQSLSGTQKTLRNFGNWLISVIITASIGGFVVFQVMKYKGEAVTWKKAFLTGILLATIPKFLLVACLYIPLCCLSLILGIVVWFLAARTILMTVLDVGKSTAVSIIIVWICLEILIGVAIFFLHLGAFLTRLATS